jgi:polynucleotide 5'-kinase involved in rRNA processing
MIKEVQKDQTLLVRGPSRVTLLEGKVEVFGKEFTPKKNEIENTIIIPSANNYPLFALESSKLEIFTNSRENIEIIEKNTVNKEWVKIKDSVIHAIKKNKGNEPLKLMVLGLSNGKTTLLKYLANYILKEGLKAGFLDSDLGQQLLYLPTTLNIGEINKNIVSSAEIETEETIFIGSTFPKANFKFIIAHSCNDLIDRFLSKHDNVDIVLIDSDGWIKTEAGIVYKNFFINTVDPDILIVFHDESVEELGEIEKNASKSKKRTIFYLKEENEYFYEKDKEERRFLRQSQFAKVLENFRKISIPLKGIKFIKAGYNSEEDKNTEEEIDLHDLISLPYHYVISALLTEDSKLIRICLLFVINLQKNYVLLFSDLNFKEQSGVRKILLGSLRLSIKGNHQGYLYL